MEVRILGPVSVDAGVDVPLDVPKERALLALLALEAGNVVPLHRLVDGLWGEDAPPTADKTLQGYVFRLRRLLGADTVATEASGYVLRVDRDAIDAHRFERLVHRGRAALDAGDASTARAAFADALSLWRGEPLDDLGDGEVRASQRARLEELRTLAQEGNAEAAIALGHHLDALPELEALVAEFPFREALWAQLMLALYRSGRQADALRAFQRVRAILGEELGIEPSPPLQRLEGRILRQDAQLDLGAPPLRANVPVPLSTFIGRAAELAHLADALHEHRLVTVVGPGGVGKTRLAIETAVRVAERFPDGVWWIDLTSSRDLDAVVGQVIAALGQSVGTGAAPIDALSAYVRARELLLVLDNCEHLRDVVGPLATRLATAGAGVTILATSRAALDVDGEVLVPIAPLSVPPAGGGELEAFDATRLFVDRSGARGRDVRSAEDRAAVADLCCHLDGLPLAIELAAARAGTLSPRELVAHLSDRFDVLSRMSWRGDPRHRSLRVALDWSYDLLDPQLQDGFDRLGVFPDDFDADAAASVCCPGEHQAGVLDVVSALVDASMVTVVPGATTRFRLLETMRAYALEHLDQPKRLAAEQAFADHYRRLAWRAAPEIGDETEGRSVREWVTRLRREGHNLRAAVEWSLEHDSPDLTMEYAPAVGWLWFLDKDTRRNIAFLERVLAVPGPPTPTRAVALLRLAWPARVIGDLARADAALDDAQTVAEQAEGGKAAFAFALATRAMFAFLRGDPEAALSGFTRALEAHDRAGSEVARARTEQLEFTVLATIGRAADVPPERLDAGQRLLEEIGDDHRLSQVWITRTLIAGSQHDADALEAAGAQALEHGSVAELGLVAVAQAHRLRGDLVGAQALCLRAARSYVDRAERIYLGLPLRALGLIAATAGEMAIAARLWGLSESFTPPWPGALPDARELALRARAELGDEEFDREVACGRALSTDEGIRLAAAVRV